MLSKLLKRLTQKTRYEDMEKMFELFLNNAKILNKDFQILPLLYGSLGLEQIVGQSLGASDVDMLIPEIFLNERWQIFKVFLESNGFSLIDAKEHQFEKDGIEYGYASIEELKNFVGIDVADIAVVKTEGVEYRKLSLPQYLLVYKRSVKDGYRINKRKKKDEEKIALIEKLIKVNSIFP